MKEIHIHQQISVPSGATSYVDVSNAEGTIVRLSPASLTTGRANIRIGAFGLFGGAREVAANAVAKLRAAGVPCKREAGEIVIPRANISNITLA